MSDHTISSHPNKPLGLGTGDFFWDAPIDRDAKIDLIRTAIDLGVVLIDTAEEYGDGESEKLVGAALVGYSEKPRIATKFSPQNCGRDELITAADRSLRRLGMERIDLYQMHWPNPSVPLEETMSALSTLVDHGKVSQIGLCNVSSFQLEQAQSELGVKSVAAVQVEYNLFERTVEYSGLKQLLTVHGIELLAYSPLDQGRFNSAPREQRNLLESIARKYDVSVARVVLNWLSVRGSAVPIVRTTSREHLRDNIAAVGTCMDDGDLDEIGLAFPVDILEIPTEQIRVVSDGEWGHDAYRTVNEARENRFGFVPSPIDLAEEAIRGEFLKPVRVVASADPDYMYDLIGGRIRYWAWVIAHDGKKPIAAQIRKGIDPTGVA
ncbi:MAG: aldo/keto reductase [Chloroflexi bacterium]|nr:aldo/keto reductase [Chloroflexota bacterium]